ncbi:Nucleoporin nup57 [Coemansia sp. RSA 1972]|nr:Nucleoporin nup57 [Coemansia sp. RSA 1972]
MATFGKSFSFSGAAGGTGQASTSGGLFGSTNQPAANSGGSLFGGDAFGKRQRAGTVNEAPAVLQTGAGLGFGQTSAAPAAGSTLGGGMFGNTQTPVSGATGGMFGSTQAPAAASTGFGSGGMFGSAATSQPAQTTSLFGASTASQPAQTTSLFGSAATSQPTQTTSLFGAPATNTAGSGLFGGQQQQQPQTMFGGQQQQQPQVQAQPQPPQALSEIDELSKQLLLIKECWDPASPNYQFRHYFYNVVEPGQAQLYQCPPGQDAVLWQQAVSDNPDPSTLVPVLASGFDDLRKRVDSQSLQMQTYQERTSEVSEKLGKILQKHHSETTVRLAECRRRQADLSQRLLEFIKLLQMLRLRGQLLHPEEELFRARVEHLEKEMTRSGSLKQRLAEIQDHVYRLQANARRRRELLGHSSGGYSDGYEVADETQLESVIKVLDDKQRGLAHMTQVISQGTESIDHIEGAIEDRYVEAQKQKEARERAQVARSYAQPW